MFIFLIFLFKINLNQPLRKVEPNNGVGGGVPHYAYPVRPVGLIIGVMILFNSSCRA